MDEISLLSDDDNLPDLSIPSIGIQKLSRPTEMKIFCLYRGNKRINISQNDLSVMRISSVFKVGKVDHLDIYCQYCFNT